LRDRLQELDPGLAAQLRRVGSRWRKEVERLVQKGERAHANRSGGGRRHARRINGSLFPLGRPQERVLCAVGLVARHGTGWTQELVAEIDPLPCEHLVIHLEGNPGEDGGT